MGLFGSVGSIIGGFAAKKASKKAEKAQSKGFRQAMDEQRLRFGQTEAQYQPWIDQGQQAWGGMGGLVGLGGADAQQAAIEQLKASPYYQSLFNTGQEALLQNASATGGLRGGDTQRGLADFGRDTLSATIQQQLANLGGIAQTGYDATGAMGGFRQNLAGAMGVLQTGQGAAKAQDYIRRGNITANQWTAGGNLLDQAAAAVAGGIGAGGGFGAMGAGGAPFDFGAMGNSIMGVQGLFGGNVPGGGAGFAGLGQAPGIMGGAPMTAPTSFLSNSYVPQVAGWGGI